MRACIRKHSKGLRDDARYLRSALLHVGIYRCSVTELASSCSATGIEDCRAERAFPTQHGPRCQAYELVLLRDDDERAGRVGLRSNRKGMSCTCDTPTINNTESSQRRLRNAKHFARSLRSYQHRAFSRRPVFTSLRNVHRFEQPGGYNMQLSPKRGTRDTHAASVDCNLVCSRKPRRSATNAGQLPHHDAIESAASMRTLERVAQASIAG